MKTTFRAGGANHESLPSSIMGECIYDISQDSQVQRSTLLDGLTWKRESARLSMTGVCSLHVCLPLSEAQANRYITLPTPSSKQKRRGYLVFMNGHPLPAYLQSQIAMVYNVYRATSGFQQAVSFFPLLIPCLIGAVTMAARYTQLALQQYTSDEIRPNSPSLK